MAIQKTTLATLIARTTLTGKLFTGTKVIINGTSYEISDVLNYDKDLDQYKLKMSTGDVIPVGGSTILEYDLVDSIIDAVPNIPAPKGKKDKT